MLSTLKSPVFGAIAGDGDPDDASSSLVASSSYLDMLTDQRRNAAFRAAIQKAVKPGAFFLIILYLPAVYGLGCCQRSLP